MEIKPPIQQYMHLKERKNDRNTCHTRQPPMGGQRFRASVLWTNVHVSELVQGLKAHLHPYIGFTGTGWDFK